LNGTQQELEGFLDTHPELDTLKDDIALVISR
jgi:hypothetical protein